MGVRFGAAEAEPRASERPAALPRRAVFAYPKVPMPARDLNLRLQVGAHPLRMQASLYEEGLLKAERRSAPYVMMLTQSQSGLSNTAGRARAIARATPLRYHGSLTGTSLDFWPATCPQTDVPAILRMTRITVGDPVERV